MFGLDASSPLALQQRSVGRDLLSPQKACGQPCMTLLSRAEARVRHPASEWRIQRPEDVCVVGWDCGWWFDGGPALYLQPSRRPEEAGALDHSSHARHGGLVARNVLLHAVPRPQHVARLEDDKPRREPEAACPRDTREVRVQHRTPGCFGRRREGHTHARDLEAHLRPQPRERLLLISRRPFTVREGAVIHSRVEVQQQQRLVGRERECIRH
mmetsp:Transcript_53157/g.146838  ORF Transcript_53157/g.146838 Transcript_53157/m.146838 type:complete len:213 (-) Transcript_53157:222-860(-)